MSNDILAYIEYLIKYFTDQQNGNLSETSRPLTFEEIYHYDLKDNSILELLVRTYYKK